MDILAPDFPLQGVGAVEGTPDREKKKVLWGDRPPGGDMRESERERGREGDREKEDKKQRE